MYAIGRPGPPRRELGELERVVLDRLHQLPEPALSDPDHHELRGEDALGVRGLHPRPHHGGLRRQPLGLVEPSLHLGERRRPADGEVLEHRLTARRGDLRELLVSRARLLDPAGLGQVEGAGLQEHLQAHGIAESACHAEQLLAHPQPLVQV